MTEAAHPNLRGLGWYVVRGGDEPGEPVEYLDGPYPKAVEAYDALTKVGAWPDLWVDRWTQSDAYRASLEADELARTPAQRLQSLRESGPFTAEDGLMSIRVPSPKDVEWAVAEIDRLRKIEKAAKAFVEAYRVDVSDEDHDERLAQLAQACLG